MKFDLRKPCKDCPFIKNTPMHLSPGRMDGIVEAIKDDLTVFPCHKTTQFDETEDGEDITVRHDKEQACAGALAYSLKHYDRIPVLARLAILMKSISLRDIERNFDTLEEPGKWPIR